MKAKTCVPIKDIEVSKLQETIASFLTKADMVELWLEHIKGITLEDLQSLLDEFGERIIYLFRYAPEKTPRFDSATRVSWCKAVSGSAALLDCDIDQFHEDLEQFQRSDLRLKVICSYHNFSETPSDQALREVVKRMSEYEPAVYKLACFCKGARDALRLLTLLQDLKDEGRRVVVLGMGKEGMITRIAGSVWGNELIFTPTPDSFATAPGQIGLADMQLLYTMLEVS